MEGQKSADAVVVAETVAMKGRTCHEWKVTRALCVSRAQASVNRGPVINAGRTGSLEGDRGVYGATGDTTNRTSSMPRRPHGLRGRQETLYAEPHVRCCGRRPGQPAPYPIARVLYVFVIAPARLSAVGAGNRSNGFIGLGSVGPVRGLPMISRISPPSSIERVIFDCDRVLVDSEHVTNRIFAEMMAELGLTLTQQYMEEHFFGRTASECVQLAQELLGAELPAVFTGRYGERSRAALANEVTLMPGVGEMFDDLAWPCAIASNGMAAKCASRSEKPVCLTASPAAGFPSSIGRQASSDSEGPPMGRIPKVMPALPTSAGRRSCAAGGSFGRDVSCTPCP